MRTSADGIARSAHRAREVRCGIEMRKEGLLWTLVVDPVRRRFAQRPRSSAPAAESAALNDCEHTAVSPSMVPIARGAMRMSGNLSQILCNFLIGMHTADNKHVHHAAGS